MLRGKPPVPDTLSQSQIGGEASSSRLNYTGETRNSSSAGAAWTRRKNTPMWVATEQSTRLVLAKSWNGINYCKIGRHALEYDKEIVWTWPLVQVQVLFVTRMMWPKDEGCSCRDLISRFVVRTALHLCKPCQLRASIPLRNSYSPTFSQTFTSKTYKSQWQQWCCCVCYFQRNHWAWTVHLFTLHTWT